MDVPEIEEEKEEEILDDEDLAEVNLPEEDENFDDEEDLLAVDPLLIGVLDEAEDEEDEEDDEYLDFDTFDDIDE
ncbi:MAG: hypothetical protein UU98_C0040G0007 [Parcubacteria group bacterium GW2011_GWD2_42_14]|nr:MAG: hypothetical protein UU98_C0040G0007 [Parcubacteria group bacterium GW2011_GWD2_42_14]